MLARGRESDSHADHCTKRARLIGDLGDASVRVRSRLTRLLRSRGIGLLQRKSLLLAHGRSVRRRSDSVRYVRYFCRADEATGMPLVDPEETKLPIGIMC
jgi:hypothetical protein